MGPLFLALVLFLVLYLVALPYVVHTILLIAAVIALVYGLYVLLVGSRGPVTRGRRYWY